MGVIQLGWGYGWAVGDVGGVTDVDEAVDRNVSSVEDMDRGWRYDTYFEMGVDLEVGDTTIYPLPTMIVFFQ